MNISTGTYVLGILDVVLYLDINAGKWGPRLWKLKVATAIQYGVINPFGHMPLEFAGNKLNGMLGPNPEGNSACFWKCSVKALLPAIGVRSFLFGDHVCSAHAGVKISYSKNAAPHNVKAHNTKRTRISLYRICQWPHGIKMRANSHAWECVKQAELERKTHFSTFSSLACALVCLQAPVWDLDGRSELQMILWVLPGLGSQHMGPKRGLRMKTLNFPLGMVSRQILIQWSPATDQHSTPELWPEFPAAALFFFGFRGALSFSPSFGVGPLALSGPSFSFSQSLSLIINFLSTLTGLQQVGRKICDMIDMMMWYDRIWSEVLWYDMLWHEMRWNQVWNHVVCFDTLV